jgi:hypothetical protein
MKKKSPDFKLKLLFLPLDASTNFFDEAVIATSIPPTDIDHDLARAAFGHSKLSPRLEMYNNFATQKFDVAACMFAVHYMFESEATITRFCENVERVLSDNGKFVVAHLDGDAVRAKLRDNDGVYAGKIDGRVVWKIARKYTEGTDANATGDVIGVYVETIGHAIDEYLVSHKDLCAFLRVRGIEEVESSMFDPASYRTSHTTASMTPSEVNYSSLHRMSIFQKKV